MQRISDVLSNNYNLICDIFTYEIAISDVYPYMNLKQFEKLCEKFALITNQSDFLRSNLVKELYRKSVKSSPNEKTN